MVIPDELDAVLLKDGRKVAILINFEDKIFHVEDADAETRGEEEDKCLFDVTLDDIKEVLYDFSEHDPEAAARLKIPVNEAKRFEDEERKNRNK